MSAVVIALIFLAAAAAIVLVADGIQLTANRRATADLRRRVRAMEARQAEFLRTLLRVQTNHGDDYLALTARCDVIAEQLIRFRLATIGPEDEARAVARILADVFTDPADDDTADASEPGPPEPGSDDHTMPPADVTDSEGKRHQ